MNADSYYEIGNGHKVCEDYAISGQVENLTYAIVCDGCSGSNNADVGARVLAIIARDSLIHMSQRIDVVGESSLLFRNIFTELLIKKCFEVKATLNLSYKTLDATLLISADINDLLITMAWGDGYIIFDNSKNERIVHELKYNSGAPYYLSYRLNSSNNDKYLKNFGEENFVRNKYIDDGAGEFIGPIEFKNDLPHDISFFSMINLNSNPVKKVFLFSDGIGTYFDDKKWIDPEGKEKKSYTALDIIPKMTNYKNIAGEFVTRRMLRVKKDMEKDHILHDDDISCSVIDIN